MRFEQLYKLITEANDFSDLPNDLSGWGYGFWIAPSGEYELLYMGEHSSVAYQIVDRLYKEEYEKIANQLFKRRIEGESNNDYYNRYELAKKQGNIMEYQDFLLLKGFVRVTAEEKTVYAGGIHGRMAPKAIKTAKDIAKFYNVEFDLGYINPPKYADKVAQ